MISASSATATPVVREYGYDADGQLTSVSINGVNAEQHSYDVNGNRTVYQRPGQAAVTAEYDSQGNHRCPEIIGVKPTLLTEWLVDDNVLLNPEISKESKDGQVVKN